MCSRQTTKPGLDCMMCSWWFKSSDTLVFGARSCPGNDILECESDSRRPIPEQQEKGMYPVEGRQLRR